MESRNARIIRVARIVGLDVGRRRIGVAISDATRTLARPVGVVPVPGLDGSALPAAVAAAAHRIAALADEEDGVAAVVVGLPRRLNGTSNEMTPLVEMFAARLGERLRLPTALQDG
jgi:putative Holliday junction resolvase